MTDAPVYELQDEPDKYPGFLQNFCTNTPDSETWKLDIGIRSFERGPLPFGADYQPVPLEFNNEGKRKKNVVGDICLSMRPFIIFSDKARQVLDAFLSPAGEFLELAAPVPGFVGYRILSRLEQCIDLERSVYTRADNGKVWVRKPTMYVSKVCHAHIFSVPEAPSSIFVSAAFRDAVSKAKLKGFDFSKEVPLI